MLEFPLLSTFPALERTGDGREDVVDGPAEQGQNDDDDNRDQDENEGVFDQPLAVFSQRVQFAHRFYLSWTDKNVDIRPRVGCAAMMIVLARAPCYGRVSARRVDWFWVALLYRMHLVRAGIGTTGRQFYVGAGG